MPSANRASQELTYTSTEIRKANEDAGRVEFTNDSPDLQASARASDSVGVDTLVLYNIKYILGIIAFRYFKMKD